MTNISTSPSRRLETSSWPVCLQYAGKSCSAAGSVARRVSSAPTGSSRRLRLARSNGSGQRSPVASYSRVSVTGSIILHGFGQPLTNIGESRGVRRMRAQPLGLAAPGVGGVHALPHDDRLARIVPRHPHHHPPAPTALRLLPPPHRQHAP